MMRSGYDDYTGIWGDEYYDSEFKDMNVRGFVQKTFKPRSSLVTLKPCYRDELPDHRFSRVLQDGTASIPYEGQNFDPNEFRVIADDWEHEHCGVCRFLIDAGHTYWQNADLDILCDACYEHYVKSTG